MSFLQKIGRILHLSVVLVIGCILFAMMGAAGIFLVNQGNHILYSVPNLVQGLEIVFVSILVNTACVFVLFGIKKADQELIPALTSSANR